MTPRTLGQTNPLHEYLLQVGLILIDNTLWSGSVADNSDHEPSTEAVRGFNLTVHQDQRVEMVLLPIGDGLTIALKIL